jgi:hypothetical protein
MNLQKTPSEKKCSQLFVCTQHYYYSVYSREVDVIPASHHFLTPKILCRASVLFYIQGIAAKDFYYSYVKKHRSRWELVACLFAACSEVPVWEILNSDRTRSRVELKALGSLTTFGQQFLGFC